MLEELHVSGLGVLEDANLELAPGLNVLTGETGAGKTMVTVGLALALGARAAPALVREGSAALSVEARFALDGEGGREAGGASDRGGAHDVGVVSDRDGAREALAEWLGEEGEPREVVFARWVGREGRGSARINGRLTSASALSELGRRLVEVHGQREVERLLTPSAQTAFLDRFAGAGHLGVLARYRVAHAELGRVRRELEDLDRQAREREREKDLLEYQIREIEAARVEPGEIAALVDEESRLDHAERILTLAAAAGAALADDGGAADRLRQVASALRDAAAVDRRAEALAERAAGAVAEADDLAAELRGYRDGIEVDPARQETVRERLRGLRELERKYGDGEDGILAYLDEARGKLTSARGRDSERATLAERVAVLETGTAALAAELTAARAEAAPRLAAAVAAELSQLGMPGASVEVTLRPHAAPGADGAERAEILLSPGPGQPCLPLARAASGGELSRLMLACRSVLADLDEVPTLVFDEVDAGIGGRTAAAVGERLEGLARRRQVLVVTHLAQIAARADRHFLVTKEAGVASVRRLDGEERVEELARMLSGSTADVSLAHARELMGTASGGS